jgi:hypothetical protein
MDVSGLDRILELHAILLTTIRGLEGLEGRFFEEGVGSGGWNDEIRGGGGSTPVACSVSDTLSPISRGIGCWEKLEAARELRWSERILQTDFFATPRPWSLDDRIFPFLRCSRSLLRWEKKTRNRGDQKTVADSFLDGS